MPDRMTPKGPDASDLPAELDPDRFEPEEADRRLSDLATLDGILADSQLTEDDVEVLDAVLKEGLRERHVEWKTGRAKRGMDKL